MADDLDFASRVVSDLCRLPEELARITALARGQVWCRTCGTSQRVDAAACLRSGWPKCCSATMTIDAPKERLR